MYTIKGVHEYQMLDKSIPGWYVVHPDENERMERILAGTNNPLYDLVHELRYNPAIAVGREVETAKNDFNKRVRGE